MLAGVGHARCRSGGGSGGGGSRLGSGHRVGLLWGGDTLLGVGVVRTLRMNEGKKVQVDQHEGWAVCQLRGR